MESVCDDPEVIAANILVRAALPSWAELGAQGKVTGSGSSWGARGELCKRLPLTFHLQKKQLGFAGLLKA